MDEPILGYTAAAIMGLVLGLLGGGGSILTVPILVYLCNVQAAIASSYSLWVVGITAMVGTYRHARSRHVSYQVVFLFGVPSLLGVTVARGILLPSIPEHILHAGSFLLTKDIVILVLFALLMITAGLAMIRQKPHGTDPPNQRLTIKQLDWSKVIFLATEGFLVGALTGLVGAGGGFLIVPILILFLGLPMQLAIGTSLAIICCKSMAGLLADPLFWKNANWQFLMSFTAASVIGIQLGCLMADRVSPLPLKMGFGWFALSLGFFMLFKELVF